MGSGSDQLAYPSAIFIDAAGDLYVADTDNHTIRKITPAGVVSTLVGQAGNGTFTSGDLPGSIVSPKSVAISDGKLYISSGHAVLKVQAK